MTPRLGTKRLLLREIHQDDLDAIFECWMQDEEVSRYMWWKASNDKKDAEEFVAFELGNLEAEKWNRWMIVLKETQELIGTCGIFYNEEEEHWDITYNLGKRFWGKGYITEAMQEVMDYAVEHMGVREICTAYAAENVASGHVLEKLGFRYEKDVPYKCSMGDIHTTGHYVKFVKP